MALILRSAESDILRLRIQRSRRRRPCKQILITLRVAITLRLSARCARTTIAPGGERFNVISPTTRQAPVMREQSAVLPGLLTPNMQEPQG